MRIILNDHRGTTNFAGALAALVDGADTLSLAVSYVQMGGWEELRRRARRLSLARMRMVAPINSASPNLMRSGAPCTAAFRFGTSPGMSLTIRRFTWRITARDGPHASWFPALT